MTDPIYGEAVAAFVEAKGGVRLNTSELIDHCRMQLASDKKPKHFFFVEKLPRNSLGKVVKTELRVQALKLLEASGT